MTAGGAQTLLKSSGLVPRGRTVLAGSGPLMWLLAWQLLNAGSRPDLILDTAPRANIAAALPRLPGFLASPYFRKGLRLLSAVRRRVEVASNVTELRAEGDGRLAEVAWRAGGKERRRPADLLLLHHGVVPDINLAAAAGVAHRWDDAQLCWRPVLDRDLASSVEGIAIAGDGGGIAGARAAEEQGRLAAIAAVRAIGGDATRDRLPAEPAVRRALARQLAGRPFLDRLYRPARAFRQPSGDTVVCRCEEVTARQVLDAVKVGCLGPNQLKALTRAGMGPCQGRLCGLTVTELIAAARGVPPEEVGHYRPRPPVKPITLAELARLPKSEAATKAVVREEPAGR
jgi:NADPH-dependent 2,4-dienoyl-CoA reductase/sulfur reductase-like enzyme